MRVQELNTLDTDVAVRNDHFAKIRDIKHIGSVVQSNFAKPSSKAT
jgi:hypothetical protein